MLSSSLLTLPTALTAAQPPQATQQPQRLAAPLLPMAAPPAETFSYQAGRIVQAQQKFGRYQAIPGTEALIAANAYRLATEGEINPILFFKAPKKQREKLLPKFQELVSYLSYHFTPEKLKSRSLRNAVEDDVWQKAKKDGFLQRLNLFPKHHRNPYQKILKGFEYVLQMPGAEGIPEVTAPIKALQRYLALVI